MLTDPYYISGRWGGEKRKANNGYLVPALGICS